MVCVFANAETDYYLEFTKTDNSTVSFLTDNLKLTFDNTNITVHSDKSTTRLPLVKLRKMQFTTNPGITVLKEDVNGDGEVTIADINVVIDMILSGSFSIMGDVNGDGEVTIADINSIINRILGLTPYKM